MKISEMIKNLQEFMAENGDLECWYAIDDEGNSFSPVGYTPSLYHADEDGEVYQLESLSEEELEEFESEFELETKNVYPICVVN